MSRRKHIVCDGCDEDMGLPEIGLPMHGRLGIWGDMLEDVHFHSVRCAAKYLEALHNKHGVPKARIAVEQLDTPEAVVEHDKEAWVRPEALVVFGKDIETARAIIRADCEAHGGVWDDSWYTSVEEIG